MKKVLKNLSLNNSNGDNNNNSNSSSLINAGGDYEQTINDILHRMKFMERDIETKVDMDVFDNEIAALRAMIGNLESDGDNNKKILKMPPTSPNPTNGLNSKDIAALKSILEKFPNIEDTMARILR